MEDNIRTITVDINDIKSIKKAIRSLNDRKNKLLKDLGYTRIELGGSVKNITAIIPGVEAILDADLTFIYSNLNLDESPKYYVYVWCDPTEKLVATRDAREFILASKFKLSTKPFYVGKGTGDRYLCPDRNTLFNQVKSKLTNKGLPPTAVKIAEGLTELEALCLEAKLIDVLGFRHLSDKGWLTNIDEGYEKELRRTFLSGTSSLAKELYNMYKFK